MSDKSILASPNWYHSTVCDVGADGVFAFGGKNTIFLLDLSDSQCCLLGQLCGHKDRVSSVRFSKAAAYSRLCASGSDDNLVMIWDIDAKASISRHNKHEAKVTAVSWSPPSPDWIISGDEHGHILSWNHQLNQVYEHKPMNGNIFCLSCSPVEEGLVVVGYKTGQILVLLLKNEKHEIACLLKGHDDEIHSLVWSPVVSAALPKEFFGVPNKPETSYTLASGSRDKTIKFWDISSGHFIAVLNVPTRASARKGSRDDQHVKSRLWSTLCWSETDPTCLFSSGYSGDILMWDLSKKSKQKWQLFGSESGLRHSRIVFSICQYAAKDSIVTVSMDRLINIWSRHNDRILCSLPSLGGFAYSMDIALMDPSSLAVGVGDNMIRIWDTSSTKDPYAVRTLWRGIGTKVMKVLWHPVKEGILGFGTEEGKVGLCNVMSQTCSVSRTYHKKSVYSLSWGPPTDIKDEPSEDVKVWHLYSCGGEGTIFEHKPENMNDAAKSFDKLVKVTNNIKHNLAGHSEVSWKQDRRVVAIGNEDGSIHLYRAPDLKMLLTINVHNKSITCLAWYPGHDQEGPNNSSFLASSSNGFDIHVHDLRNAVEAHDKGLDEHVVVTDSFQRLAGHTGRVTNIKWSPHSVFRLASSSYDGTVQVWDVLKGEGLANFRGHNGRVMSVVWSIMNHDVIYSGGEDFTVHCWTISQQPFKDPPVKAKKSVTKSKSKKKNISTVSENAEEAQATESQTGVALSCREVEATYVHVESPESNGDHVVQAPRSATAATAANQSGEVSLQFLTTVTERNRPNIFDHVSTENEPALNVKGEAKKKRKKGKSLFPLSASADNKSRLVTSKECIEVAKYFYENEDTKKAEDVGEQNINLGLFTSRDAAFNMLTEEGAHHCQSGNVDYQLQLEVWKGNIANALEMAVEKRQLTDWLVGLSHLAGKRVQLAVTEAFAEQLASQGSYHRAALYYLGCHKVYDAIHMFHKSGMYREAVALAKVRLLPSDPVLLDIYSSWARKLENESAFEQAAKCYLACGLGDDAIRVLTRRGDEVDMVAAAEVARLSGKIDQSEALILKCALSAIRSARWCDALEMVRNYSDMQVILMMLYTHEAVVVCLKQTGSISPEDFPHIQDVNARQYPHTSSELPGIVSQFKAQYTKRKDSDPTTHWGLAHVGCSGLLVQILENWWSYSGLNPDEKRLHGFYVQISALAINQTTPAEENTEQTLFNISKEVCLGLVAGLVGKPDICLQHFLQAIIKCRACGYPRLLRNLFGALFPFGLESWYMVNELSQCPIRDTQTDVNNSFRNIIAFYYRELLDEALLAWDTRTEITLNRLSHEAFVEGLCPTGNEKSGQRTPCSNKETTQDFGTIQECMSSEGVYKIALVSPTMLLSEFHAQFQNTCKHRDGNVVMGEEESLEDCKEQPGQYGAKSGNNGSSAQLSACTKLPFPDVIESARVIVKLCLKILEANPKIEQSGLVVLTQQVIAWAIRHVRDTGEDKLFFKTSLDKLNEYCEV